MSIRIILAAFLLTLAACSPYSSQIKSLDKAYAAGRVPVRDYYALRGQLLDGDSQWRANLAANLNQVSVNLNQTTANINQQNAINAYNARTNVYAQPQNVNVYHSGNVNHNVNGTIRHRYYGY